MRTHRRKRVKKARVEAVTGVDDQEPQRVSATAVGGELAFVAPCGSGRRSLRLLIVETGICLHQGSFRAVAAAGEIAFVRSCGSREHYLQLPIVETGECLPRVFFRVAADGELASSPRAALAVTLCSSRSSKPVTASTGAFT